MSSQYVPLSLSRPAVAGVDEAGRGPLAGPLVVAAVILDPQRYPAGLDDSKRLSAKRRVQLFDAILEQAQSYRIEIIEPAEIDRLNIFQATMLGMRHAVAGLSIAAELALIDGNKLPAGLPCPGQAIVGGDGLEPAISAASILAKVSRDRLMQALHQQHPQYGFDQHMGYPTPLHLRRLAELGAAPCHRRSYRPVQLALQAAPTQTELRV